MEPSVSVIAAVPPAVMDCAPVAAVASFCMCCVVLEEAVQLPTFFDPLTLTYSSKLPSSPFQSAVYENVAEFAPSEFELDTVTPPELDEKLAAVDASEPAAAALLVFVIHFADEEPLAEKSHAYAEVASAMDETAANIILLICFITLLKML